MSEQIRHWTEKTSKDYRFRIAADFVTQLEIKMEELGWTDAKLADMLGVTKGRVSQLLNNPGNLGLDLMVRCARTLGLKLAIVAYDDGDKDNQRGPINSEIFRICWEKSGKPSDFWAFEQSATTNLVTAQTYSVTDFSTYAIWGQPFGTVSLRNLKSLIVNIVGDSRDMVTVINEPTFEKNAA